MKTFFKAVGFLALGLAFVAGGAWVSEKIRKQENPPVNKVTVSCPPDRLSYTNFIQDQGNVVKLIPNRKAMSAANGEFINSEVVITKNETKDSKVACGYMFVRAGTIKYGALQSWENLYINPNDFGGHIVPNDSISRNDGKEYSEYLFSLDKIQYRRTRNDREILSADWAALLNVSPEVKFNIALNTEEATGFIDELLIAYKCWDPATGKESTGCKLTVKNSLDTQSPNPTQ